MHTIPFDLELNHTRDAQLRANPKYSQIFDCIQQLWSRQLLVNAAGNCVSVSAMLQHQLQGLGIESIMYECKLMVTERLEQGLRYSFVGYEQSSMHRRDGILDTHVVVITTNTEPQILIDLTVDHVLPRGKHWVIEPVVALTSPVILDCDLGTHQLTYSTVQGLKLPELHETGILERIRRDREMRSQLRLLKIVLFTVCVLTLANLFMNTSQLMFRVDLIETLERHLIKHPD